MTPANHGTDISPEYMDVRRGEGDIERYIEERLEKNRETKDKEKWWRQTKLEKERQKRRRGRDRLCPNSLGDEEVAGFANRNR